MSNGTFSLVIVSSFCLPLTVSCDFILNRRQTMFQLSPCAHINIKTMIQSGRMLKRRRKRKRRREIPLKRFANSEVNPFLCFRPLFNSAISGLLAKSCNGYCRWTRIAKYKMRERKKQIEVDFLWRFVASFAIHFFCFEILFICRWLATIRLARIMPCFSSLLSFNFLCVTRQFRSCTFYLWLRIS